MKEVTVNRNRKVENDLLELGSEWLNRAERSPGIHASDILEPRLAYWRRKVPKDLPDRLVTRFLIGKVLHAIVLKTVEGAPFTYKTDEGSFTCKELGIEYSPDKIHKNKIRELKTTRSQKEPKTVEDLKTYIDQIEIYMACTNQTEAQIWILFLTASLTR